MLFSMHLFALALAAGEPEVGELHLDRDWIVGCDNLRFCHAVSLPVPADGDDRPLGDGNMTVSITRGGGPLDSPIIQLAVVEDIPGVIMSDIRGVLVDTGDTLLDLSSKNGVYNLNADASRRVLRVMKEHNEIALVDAKRKSLARASLKGLMAALSYMDERQYRRDTVSALANPGRKPANYQTVPPMTPPRQVRIAPPTQTPPTMLEPAKISELRAQDPCLEYHSDTVADEPEYHRLDNNNSLLVLPTTCGGYNPYRQLYVIGNEGTVTKAVISLRKSSEYIDDIELPDIGWNKERQRLLSFGRGRVLADCGEIQEFAWSEGRFTLTLHSSMTPCRGSRDYITTYRLETVIEGPR
jgi:Protein of unknown function (DUF1176)